MSHSTNIRLFSSFRWLLLFVINQKLSRVDSTYRRNMIIDFACGTKLVWRIEMKWIVRVGRSTGQKSDLLWFHPICCLDIFQNWQKQHLMKWILFKYCGNPLMNTSLFDLLCAVVSTAHNDIGLDWIYFDSYCKRHHLSYLTFPYLTPYCLTHYYYSYYSHYELLYSLSFFLTPPLLATSILLLSSIHSICCVNQLHYNSSSSNLHPLPRDTSSLLNIHNNLNNIIHNEIDTSYLWRISCWNSVQNY